MVAVCDVAIERAKECAEQYQIPQAFGDVDEMLKACDFDMLINLTKNPARKPLASALGISRPTFGII